MGQTALQTFTKLTERYGLTVVVLLFAGGFVAFLIYKILQGSGLFNRSEKLMMESVKQLHDSIVGLGADFTAGITDMRDSLVCTVQDVQKTVDRLTTTIERGYNKPEHTEVVRDFAFGRERDLKTSMIDHVMTLYESGYNVQTKVYSGNVETAKQIVRAKIEAEIRRIDGQIFKVPNVSDYSIPSDKKIEILTASVENILTVITTEQRKEEVRRKVSGIVEDIIFINRF